MTKKEWEKLHPQDKREIINLIEFKKRLKKVLTSRKEFAIIDLSKERN